MQKIVRTKKNKRQNAEMTNHLSWIVHVITGHLFNMDTRCCLVLTITLILQFTLTFRACCIVLPFSTVVLTSSAPFYRAGIFEALLFVIVLRVIFSFLNCLLESLFLFLLSIMLRMAWLSRSKFELAKIICHKFRGCNYDASLRDLQLCE